MNRNDERVRSSGFRGGLLAVIVFWVITPCMISLVQCSEEHAAFTFRVTEFGSGGC
jgi:hypothetical protein